MAAAFNEVPIEDLCKKVTSGSTPLRSRSDFYDGGSIDWYKTGELKDWYLEPAEERITEKALKETAVKLFPSDTVLMAMYGDGKTITSMGMLRAPAATNQACSAMLVDDEKCNSRYFFYALKGRRALLLKVASGGAQRNLSGKLIKEFRLPVPPLPVQQRIAGILSAYDELIENSQRRIKILEAMARALYREWFVHFRFPGHEDHPRVASPLGEIPLGWEAKKLADLITYSRRATKPGPHLEERRYVPIDCLPPKSLALLEARPIEEAQSSLQLFEKGDILFGAMRPYFHKVVVAPFPGVTRTTCFVFKPVRPEWHAFATMTAFDEATVAYANAHSQGATIPYAVWDRSLSEMPLVLPSTEVLQQFETAVAPMLVRLAQSFFALGNLRRTRDLLLSRLLSGQIEVEAA